MKIIIILCLMAILTLSLAFASERVLITFDDNANQNIVTNAGGKIIHSYNIVDNVVAARVPAQAIQGIKNNPHVISVEADAVATISAPPDKCSPWPECKGGTEEPPTEPPQTSQETPWGISQISADLTNTTGAGVSVCIIDTGVDKDHPDLADNIVGGVNYVAKGRTVDPTAWEDDNGHGSHVAGTIAAVDNSVGVVGVAPQADLLIVKALDRRGSGYISDIIAGIEYCVNNNADVISMSLGSGSHSIALEGAVTSARNQGSVLVAAAGNDYGGLISFPARYSAVIAVGATDINNNIASFSNVGPQLELVAPGVSVISTWKDGGYNSISGTSMATPHVAGVVALAIESGSTDPRTLLQTTADDLGAAGRDSIFGFGLVDALFN